MVEQAIAAAAGGVETLADEIGVSYGTVWSWARGKRRPSPRNMKRLAKVLQKRARLLERLAADLDAAAGER